MASKVKAVKIQGRQGRHKELINGTFEQMDSQLGQHNGMPAFCARSVTPVYLYHTGKSRWVVSKRLDDGSKCYCFCQSTSADPSSVEGPWVCCDDDNEWRPDANMSVTVCMASNDKFVALRKAVEGELNQMGVNDPKWLRQMWKRLDYNGNNIVSLAEIDKMVVELVSGGTWPDWLNNKPALMRAYKKTILVDGDGDDWVEKKEFHALMLNIFWFNKLFKVFQILDSGNDRRIDVGEFVQGLQYLGLHLSQQEAAEEFQKIDTNHGGQVLFVEFCAYVRKRVNPDHDPNFDADVVSGEHCGKTLRKSHGDKATHAHYIRKKNMKMFNDLELKIKAIMRNKKDLRSLWDHLDYNGNNIVSLAEIDKLAVEKFPLLNHKPALMRAYKATIRSGDGDDWVEKKEFKALLGNLFYFNKLFWIFDQSDKDKDRRLTSKEFMWCLCVCGAKMSDQEMMSDFKKVDRNGGGIILFDEFCYYFTAKACPECFTGLVE